MSLKEGGERPSFRQGSLQQQHSLKGSFRERELPAGEAKETSWRQNIFGFRDLWGMFSNNNEDGTREPKDRPITQQTLAATKPVLTPVWVVTIFFIIAAVLLPLGAVLLVFGLKPVEVSSRYDQTCIPNAPDNSARQRYLWENVNNTQALQCTTTLTIPEDMSGPIYVYYELNGFYQNHRRYVRSRSNVQLAKAEGEEETLYCDPLEYYAGDKSKPIDPCGLIAWTYFNDSYTMEVNREDGSTEQLDISAKGIAFDADVTERFADYKPVNHNPDLSQWRGGGQIQGSPKTDERFINWMRIAALPNFRKLWGKINTDFKKGELVEVIIDNRYNTYSFDGTKSIVLANTSWLGGHNIFLGTAYLVTGAVSFLLGLLYFFVRLARPRKFGDISQLKEVDT